MAEYSPSLGLPSRHGEHTAALDAAKGRPDGCQDAWGREVVIRDQRQWVACPLGTAASDAWDAARPDALAFRQLAGRDADAEKLADLVPDDRARDDRHSAPQSPQTDRARDAARSKTRDEWELDKPDAGPSAARSCAGRVEAVAQSAFRELAVAQLEPLALPPVVPRAGLPVAIS